MSSSLSEKDLSVGELKYGETKASKQIIAEHRVDVIIKAGDCIAFLKE
jgi:hypothetical protein